jgi:hypothetical protein
MWRDGLQAGGIKQLPEYLGKLPLAAPLIQEQLRTFVVEGYEGSIVEGTKTVGAFVFAQLSGLARDVVSVAIDFSIMLFTLFFFYKDGEIYLGGSITSCPWKSDINARCLVG